ncbi:MAG TPA: ABC transporter substrate-binding protein [Candidatus Pullichristensenella excrementigallinarum]|uniref:ABC transporter substrate-binding protein n=1 Tax=Candidatus Pullichristensenella excrementigallinarum TaxID=2840907 RepID=A0A9D1IAJ8_9FIRM|nr:ABC transporter substrate-binding protein [Candidatus Pullichristensenella excrementigallinarum]
MKRILALVLALTMTLACATAFAQASGDPIKIGLTTVLTGDRSLEGEYATNVVEIVTEEINSAGGVLGRPIEIVIEDAQGTDVGAVTAWKKLAADDDIVAIISSDSSNDNLAVADLAKEAQILTTGQGSSPTLRDTCNENPWMFQLRACDVTLCEALIAYAVEELGYQTFAIIHETESSSVDQAGLFTSALAKYGIEPELTLGFATGTKDLTAQLVQIQAANVDAVIGAAFSDQAALLLQQMRMIGMEDMPVLGSNGFTDVVTIRLAGDACEGVMAATHWAPSTTNPKGAALQAKYKELFGEDCGKSAAQVYDHILVICEAIERAGTTDRAAVRDAMNTIDSFEGAMTTYDCTTNGDCGRGGLLVVVQNGEAVVLDEIISEK